jgi:hypothetical protein
MTLDFETYLRNLNLQKEFKEWIKSNPSALKEISMESIVVFMHDLYKRWQNDWEGLKNLSDQLRYAGGRESEKATITDMAYL